VVPQQETLRDTGSACDNYRVCIPPESHRRHSRSVWDDDLKGPVGALSTLVAFGSALVAILQWPAEALIGLVLLAIVGVIATRTSSLVRVVKAAVSAALVLAVVFVFVGLTGSNVPNRHLPRAAANFAHRSPAISVVGARPGLRELIPDGRVIWGLAGKNTLSEFDERSFAQLGYSLKIGQHVEHIMMCQGRLFATYDHGYVAEVDRLHPRIVGVLSYGHPIDAGRLTGLMACGGGSLFVALPREAAVARISIAGLRFFKLIHVGDKVTGLAYSDGVLYVEDASQSAVITVNLTDNVPWRWIVTIQKPSLISARGSSGAIVTHGGSRCLGTVEQGQRLEQGVGWALKAAATVMAVGPTFGVVADSSGYLYRFDASTGSINARPVKLPLVGRFDDAIIAPDGRVIINVPSTREVIVVPPDAWQPVTGEGPPTDSDCAT
jgi:hypothetical protein